MVSVCLPSDALLQEGTYHLTWVSLTLEVGCLFTAAPAKHSCCSLPWTRGISSSLPLLTLNVEWLLSALLRPRSHHSLDVGLLLSAAAPDLRRFCRHTYFPFPTQPDHQIRLISFPHFEHGLEGSYNSLSLNPSFEVRETEAYKEQKLVQGDIKNSSSHMDQSLLTYF